MGRLLTILLLSLAATTASAAENNQLFILDASGSMWGRIDGTPKISVAKEVMSGLVEELPADSKTGLMAYGHRRKGDCTDIESLVGLGPLDRDAMIERVQSLNPKGKTPITDAVKRAVEELRRIEETASVVLVSDGLESCGGDPCEAVKAAKRTGVDFRMHVVGFGLGETDPSQLKCMAEAGGGRYYTAANAEELTGALKEAVGVQPGLVLEVTSNGEPTPALVRVFEAGSEDSVKTSRLGQGPDDRPANPARIALEPGTYDVRVKPSKLAAEPQKTLTGVEVPEEGEVERTVDFSDGTLVIEAMANDAPTPVELTINRAGSDERVLYENHYDGPEALRLPPGEYDAVIEPNKLEMGARELTGIRVAAGEKVTRSVDFSPATLAFEVTANGEGTPARLKVYKAGTQERVVSENHYEDAEPLRVPPGDYDVIIEAKKLEMDARELAGISVAGGETVTRSVDFSPATLAFDVTANGEPTPARLTISRAGTDERVVRERHYEDAEPLRLPPGDYDVVIEAKKLEMDARELAGISVAGGETVTRSVAFKPGTLAFDVTAGGKRTPVRLTINKAGTDERVLRERHYDDAEPLRLPPGDYDVRVQPKKFEADARWLKGIALSAAETIEKDIEFSRP